MEIQKILENYGLDPKEAALYVAALQLGDSQLALVAKKAGVVRSSAYQIAKGLEEKGLMGNYEKRGTLYFSATAPSVLLARAKERFDDLAKVVPELAALQKKTPAKPRVTYYEGREGYIAVAEDSLAASGEMIRHIGSLKNLYGVIGGDYDRKHYIPKRVVARINLQCLYHKTDALKTDPAELREVRHLPDGARFGGSKLIYRNKTAIFTSAQELITVLVESDDIAEMETSAFDILWQTAGPASF